MAYVIVGTTGAYSDRTEWIVGTCGKESLAVAVCEELNKWLIDNCCHVSQDDWPGVVIPPKGKGPPFDELFQCYENGVSYSVVKAATFEERI